MAHRSNISSDDFDRLLRWFGADREASAQQYVQAHAKLTRLFYFNGCNCPEDLADEVMGRVAKKLPLATPDHITVLLSFFRFVCLEHWSERKRFVEEFDVREGPPPDADEMAVKETRDRCVEICLNKLSQDDGQLLREYYQYETGAKIQHRKVMAEARHISLNALRLKACRLKCALAVCVKRCCQSGGKTGVQ